MSSSFQKNKLPPYFSPSLNSPYLKPESNVTTHEKRLASQRGTMIYLRTRNVVPWCSSSATGCCSSDLRSILTSAVWKIIAARLPDGPIWKCGCLLLVGQSSHKNNSSSSYLLPFCKHKILINAIINGINNYYITD